ncbi:MAG: extracellular solute-binding protein, partial [Devosia sp.]
MNKIRLMAALAAVMVAAPAVAQEITAWDVNVTRNPAYFAAAKAAFEKAHPGVTLTWVAQPDAEYYNLLNTAFASKTGPDVIWANGGANAKSLTGSLLPLDDKLPDLISQVVGKSAFTGTD